MAALLLDVYDLVPQCDGTLSMLLKERLLLLRCRHCLNGLVCDASGLHDLAELIGLDYSIRELAMEQLAPLFQIESSMFLKTLLIGDIVDLFLGSSP